jgi:hypothetical protein
MKSTFFGGRVALQYPDEAARQLARCTVGVEQLCNARGSHLRVLEQP